MENMIQDTQNMKVLLAEDDRTSHMILATLLKKWGYQVLSAFDGNTAFEALQEVDAPKLALLDWNMPGMEGPEVCRRVRELETLLPPYLVIVTAREAKADTVAGLEAGANDYITKPFDRTELSARIRVGQRMLDLQAQLNCTRQSL
jgi:DNA-binding response OmpR family regulator